MAEKEKRHWFDYLESSTISKLHRFLERVDGVYIFTFALFFTAAVYMGDSATGPFIDFGIFYLVPIALTAWYVGKIPACFIAFVAALSASEVHFEGFPQDTSRAAYAYDFMAELMLLVAFCFICLKLRATIDKLREAGITDQLTGIRSRSSFLTAAKLELMRSLRFKQSMTIVLVAVRNVQKVNSTQGIDQGDLLLISVARTLSAGLHGGDIAGRFGGSRFAVLLPQTNSERAKLITERLKTRLAEATNSYHNITYDIGAVTYFPTKPTDVDNLIKAAEKLISQVRSSSPTSVQFAEY
jgi:diguanylate cyclase (GGDEF)-like protein